MAFDSARAEVILFGGRNRAGNFDDTWAWNGTAWTRRMPAASPTARFGHAMAFDSVRGEVVLFGGDGNPFSPGATPTDETWVWNGALSTWTQASALLAPAHALSARDGLRHLARRSRPLRRQRKYGQPRRQMGVERPNRGLVAARPAFGAAARVGHGVAYDSACGEVILHGGKDGPFAYRSDTWRHITLGGSCATNNECSGAAAFCLDGVCCNVATCGTCQTCGGTSPGKCSDVLNTEDADTCAARDGKSCSNVGECKAALGAVAAEATRCASGYLVDGVCCLTPKCGACESCNPAQKEHDELPGICSAAKSGTDLHDDCGSEEAATCGRTGQCDGNRGCAVYKDDTACGTQGVCSGAGACIEKGASCDGDHTVIAPDGARTDCGTYKCEGATCKSSCTRNTDCVGEADCTHDGKCVAYTQDTWGNGGCSASSRNLSRHEGVFAHVSALAGFFLMRRRRRTSETKSLRP